MAEPVDLRRAGLKATLPRLKILQLLEEHPDRHLRAEDVYKLLLESGEDVGLATVYRVLTQFEQAGLVSRHHFEEGHAVFELNQGGHHDHVRCVSCGRVDEFVDELIEQRQQEIARRLGYEMTGHHLYIYGKCPACRRREAAAAGLPTGGEGPGKASGRPLGGPQGPQAQGQGKGQGKGRGKARRGRG
ncbi:MAG: ferric iron uptake transcriptional regulator [Gammaproteobacteria bacterium]|nr:MAG: ferric iron uptake transcriptional regulator [Gammaproteobacteria bacterium]